MGNGDRVTGTTHLMESFAPRCPTVGVHQHAVEQLPEAIAMTDRHPWRFPTLPGDSHLNRTAGVRVGVAFLVLSTAHRGRPASGP